MGILIEGQSKSLSQGEARFNGYPGEARPLEIVLGSRFTSVFRLKLNRDEVASLRALLNMADMARDVDGDGAAVLPYRPGHG